MFAKIRRSLSQLFSKSNKINNEPLNKVSLIVIIVIDIFILYHVFIGLDDISQWHISPTQAYPCYSDWENYRTKTTKDKDYEIVNFSLEYQTNNQTSLQQTYQQYEEINLGKVSEICLKYAEYKDKINNPENQQIIKTIAQKQDKISTLEQTNRNIQAKYDSTLLEKIAGQPREQSINQVSAENAKQELAQNNRQISTLKQENTNLKNKLLAKPESGAFITFIKDDNKFSELEKGYKQASFWYPSIQLGFQSIFLLPLILIALLIHNFAQRRRYGLIALISWHLLVIFFIPLILKIFEFLQIGVIFKFFFDIISALFGGLLFLVSYIYILLIPLIGFGIITFFQKIVFNAKLQAVSRVQKSRCIRCAKKIQPNDVYCPHCGYDQYLECQNCHELTYKGLLYCKHCGHIQDSGNL
ncbi:zinc-ribbon domain-containing protein [Cylindrospermum sp. FACHB-282]|uniref:zinc-ribbon domain-containing protein n=1 Tax=Cylindrospermum sp. FACHB-282 TaxID=2692794 RepID=UPI001684FD3E|nr:zinc-ribbon domain-containing protein [Cylindrospermum sp. FACHB-282]MBD2383984.1 zinc-ribbon domain-containing protein [Cylindrospermum sp. FACHB-282]